MSPRCAIALAALAALVPCSAASAATTRFVSPAGSNAAPCTQASPCSIDKAVSTALTGDTVLFGPGTYGTPAMAPAADVTDGARVLTFAGAPGSAPLIWNRRVLLNTSGSTLSNLDLRAGSGFNVSNLLIMLDGTRADRISVRDAGTGSDTVACRLEDTAVLLNSVCEARRSDSVEVEAIEAGGTTVRNGTAILFNVTAVANATNGVGVEGHASSLRQFVRLTNVIALGPTQGVEVTADGAQVNAVIDHSDISSLNVVGDDASANVTASLIGVAPQFVDQAGGDFHELASSPTVDVGRDSSAIGLLDLGGAPRTLGAHIDMGAYELVTFDNLCAATKAAGTILAPALCSVLQGAKALPALRRFYLNSYINAVSGRASGLPADQAAALVVAAKELL